MFVHRVKAVTYAIAAGALIGCGNAGEAPQLAELELVEHMAVGELDHPLYSFNAVSSVVIGDGGVAFIADAADLRVRVYGPGGEFIRDIGRRGHGPGEFQNISTVGVAGDGIYVIDRLNDRITWFDGAGAVLATRKATSGSFGSTATGVLFPLRLLGGGYEAVTVLHPPSASGKGTLPNDIILIARDQVVTDTLVNRHNVSWLHVEKLGRDIHMPNLFAQRLHVSVSPAGRYMATIRAYPDSAHAPGEFEARLHRPAHGTLWTRTFRSEPVVYGKARADSAIRNLLAPMIERHPVVTVSEYKAMVTVPDYEPAVQGLSVGDDGSVYVRVPARERNARWLSINPKGTARGIVSLPPNSFIVWATSDAIVVVEKDLYDVPRVIKYGVRETRPN